MSFSQFKNIPQVQQHYNIHYQEQHFIEEGDFVVATSFQQELEFNLNYLDVFASEAARCEIVIFPILREVYKTHADKLALWIQKPINLDNELNGAPDYLISKKSEYGKLFLEHPLLAVVEAKKNDFEQGWGQCLAELVAAQKLNNDEKLAVYGIVTDGKTWEFGFLQQNLFIQQRKAYTLDYLDELFGAVDFIFRKISFSISQLNI